MMVSSPSAELGVGAVDAPARGARGRGQRADAIAGVVVIVAIVAAIQIASFFVPAYIMPAPLVILRALWNELTHDTGDVVATLLRLFAAVLASLVVGSALGVVMLGATWLRPYIRVLLVVVTGVPALSWMLIAVFWFRNTEERIFFILFLIILPFYAINVYDGLQALPKELLEMVESFRPRPLQTFRYLLFPHLIPYVILTTKSAIGYAIRMVVFAELIGAAVGIGAKMAVAESAFEMDDILAWTVLLVAFNLILQALIGAIERRLLHWRGEVAVR
ncbi:MAG TPA: ABC transporter permease subunit [Candidatus Sulfotelmatobacter sp.]|nr:ABC transporter permease subunit [Candidatus Sulfotelmatobacter sp.]